MERTIIKLKIFDFDGTLINTELPDTGKARWKEIKGEDWPHQGWWGKADSLDIDVFENNVIEHVIEAFEKEKEDESSLTVMLTGRRHVLATQVEKIIDKHGLVFDRKYYNTGGDTITCKLRKLEELIEEFPTLEVIELWEDRIEHIEKFQKWGETVDQEVIVNFVEPIIDRFNG